MKRGEIYYADLNPTIGSEINKRRPVLIVSNDANNRAANMVTVLPLTSKTERVFPFEVLLAAKSSGLSQNSKALAQQIRTLSKSRIVSNKIGELSPPLMLKIEAAIKLHLSLQ
ncbi:MAG: type II toxin-antitoxin system PemK/MazF family toxin [Candidatus Nitrotoga sp.]